MPAAGLRSRGSVPSARCSQPHPGSVGGTRGGGAEHGPLGAPGTAPPGPASLSARLARVRISRRRPVVPEARPIIVQETSAARPPRYRGRGEPFPRAPHQ